MKKLTTIYRKLEVQAIETFDGGDVQELGSIVSRGLLRAGIIWIVGSALILFFIKNIFFALFFVFFFSLFQTVGLLYFLEKSMRRHFSIMHNHLVTYELALEEARKRRGEHWVYDTYYRANRLLLRFFFVGSIILAAIMLLLGGG